MKVVKIISIIVAARPAPETYSPGRRPGAMFRQARRARTLAFGGQCEFGRELRGSAGREGTGPGRRRSARPCGRAVQVQRRFSRALPPGLHVALVAEGARTARL